MEGLQKPTGVSSMNRKTRSLISVCFFGFLFYSCAHVGNNVSPSPQGSLFVTPELEVRVLSLNPDAISEREVAEVLSKCPAPRVFSFDGSVPIVTMESFGRFLVRMGYPEASIRDPRNGSYSYSSYRSSAEMAGMVAWYYEKEGMRPMIIGHSQGGMLSVKILHELAGAFREEIEVTNPYTGQSENRRSLTDPLSGKERPVVGLKLGFASAIATGKGVRFVLAQWNMLSRLRKIPDTVEEFVGFHLQNDLISGTLFGVGQGDQYTPVGSAKVRNIVLPPESNHLGIILIEGLGKNDQTRAWINSYGPSNEPFQPPPAFEGETRNILFAAEVWFNIKKHWCLELKRWILAGKATGSPAFSAGRAWSFTRNTDRKP